jgi:nitrous oxidase accessory protein NosD
VPQNLHRRHILSLAPLISTLLIPPAHSKSKPASSSDTITVSEGQSISQAIAAAQDYATIIITPGTYKERLVISRPVTLITAARGEDDLTTTTTLLWSTNDHYESVINIKSPGVVVSGLNIQHSSPSIADNFAVKIEAGDVQLLNCTVSSKTGTGIGIETPGSSGSGNTVILNECIIKDCNLNGIGVFGEGTGAEIVGCEIECNKGDGVLVGDGAVPIIEGCTIIENKKYGLRFRDCGGEVKGNVVKRNGMGAVEFRLLRDVVLEEQLLALRGG